MYLKVPGFEPLTNTLSPSLKLCFTPDGAGVDVACGSDFTLVGGTPLFKLVLELDKDLFIGLGILGVVGRGILGVVGRWRRLGVVGRLAGVFSLFPFTGIDTSEEVSSPRELGMFGWTGAPGVRVNFVILQNIPRFGSHWKYLTPLIEPSFFPIESSRTTPAHSPAANCVSPRNAMYPGFEPLTKTRSPIMKSSLGAGGANSSSPERITFFFFYLLHHNDPKYLDSQHSSK